MMLNRNAAFHNSKEDWASAPMSNPLVHISLHPTELWDRTNFSWQLLGDADSSTRKKCNLIIFYLCSTLDFTAASLCNQLGKCWGVHEGSFKARLEIRKASAVFYVETASNASNVDTSLGNHEYKVTIHQTNQKKTSNEPLDDPVKEVRCVGSPLYKLGSRAKTQHAKAVEIQGAILKPDQVHIQAIIYNYSVISLLTSSQNERKICNKEI